VTRCIVVTGSRRWSDRARLFAVLDSIERAPGCVLVHGGAAGADSLADEWAALRGVERWAFHPDYERWGRSAPAVRNSQMCDMAAKRYAPAAVCVAFPLSGSRGTWHCVSCARAVGLAVRVVRAVDPAQLSLTCA